MKPLVTRIEELEDSIRSIDKPLVSRLRDYHIIDKQPKRVKFRLTRFQRRFTATIALMRRLQVPVRIVILKSRQLGFSTNAAALLYGLAEKYPNRRCVEIAHNAESSRKIFGITGNIHRHLEDRRPLESKKQDALKMTLEFKAPHSSAIHCMTAGGGEIGRGFTFSYAHFSEVAFWEQPETVWVAVQSAVPKPEETWDSMIIVESTANGPNNLFHRLWEQAFKPSSPFELYQKILAWQKTGDPGYIGLFFSWKDDPTYSIPVGEGEEFIPDETESDFQKANDLSLEQLKWARRVREQDLLGSWEKFHQEYPVSPEVAFLFSGYAIYDRKAISTMIAGSERKPPEFIGEIALNPNILTPTPVLTEKQFGKLHIWEHPNPDTRYAMGVDFSEGVGRDFNEICVLKVQPAELVAYFYNNLLNPTEAALIAWYLGCYYNWALIGAERNSIGMAGVLTLKEGHIDVPQIFEYPNIYYHVARDKRTNQMVDRIGFPTNRSTKSTAIAHLQETIKRRRIKIWSPRVLGQLEGFFSEGTKGSLSRYIQKTKDPLTGDYNDDAETALHIAEEMRREVLKRTHDHKIEYATW